MLLSISLLFYNVPFLATANASFNSRSRVIDVSAINMRARVNILTAFSQPVFEDEFDCFFIDVVDEIIEDALPTILNTHHLVSFFPVGF